MFCSLTPNSGKVRRGRVTKVYEAEWRICTWPEVVFFVHKFVVDLVPWGRNFDLIQILRLLMSNVVIDPLFALIVIVFAIFLDDTTVIVVAVAIVFFFLPSSCFLPC